MGVDEIAERLLQQCNIDVGDFPGAASNREVVIKFATYRGDFFVYCFNEGTVDETSELKGDVDTQRYIVPTTGLTAVVQAYELMLIKCGVKFIENPSELAIDNKHLMGIRLKRNEDDPTFRRILNVADKIAQYMCFSLKESALETYF